MHFGLELEKRIKFQLALMEAMLLSPTMALTNRMIKQEQFETSDIVLQILICSERLGHDIVKLEKGAEDCVRMKADGTMNDALCDLTWAGPKRQNIKMGYICEMPTNDRKRRTANNGVPQACQVEYRTRRGAVESIRMNCKEWISK